ncbi:MAG: glycerol-3-phosphate dehydrogenase [Flavobacteriales bacterium]|jgi:glycerol-3-phosphate dehydrogenase (NAD(P)+)|nr:glycerol-3-phosphate dehydrogenase [Candidatus Arcticimaribacter sp.]|tara:strand:+ start:11589 stop:12623 length:1035 start_codon:yes stop_codon:yes gene_type:complete
MITTKRPEFKHIILKNKLKVAILGGGSWATALIKILLVNKRNIGWYMRSEKNKEFIERNQNNPTYLTSTTLNTKRLKISTDINLVVKKADIVIVAIPSAFIKEEFSKLRISLKNKIVVSAVKGVIPENMKIPGTFFHEDFEVPLDRIGVICGPCHAEEVAMEKLSYLTVASQNQTYAKCIAAMLKTKHIRTKVSNDIIGTEYASMLKNIYAIAAGIAHGLGYGDNFQSVLMSNAIRETKRFIKDVHKMKRNINNSAYLGDLLVTGYSVFSRNRTFGNMIGKGYTVKAAQLEMSMIAEGYYASKSARIINSEFKTQTPIIEAVYLILYERKNAQKVFDKLVKKLD